MSAESEEEEARKRQQEQLAKQQYMASSNRGSGAKENSILDEEKGLTLSQESEAEKENRKGPFANDFVSLDENYGQGSKLIVDLRTEPDPDKKVKFLEALEKVSKSCTEIIPKHALDKDNNRNLDFSIGNKNSFKVTIPNNDLSKKVDVSKQSLVDSNFTGVLKIKRFGPDGKLSPAQDQVIFENGQIKAVICPDSNAMTRLPDWILEEQQELAKGKDQNVSVQKTTTTTTETPENIELVTPVFKISAKNPENPEKSQDTNLEQESTLYQAAMPEVGQQYIPKEMSRTTKGQNEGVTNGDLENNLAKSNPRYQQKKVTAVAPLDSKNIDLERDQLLVKQDKPQPKKNTSRITVNNPEVEGPQMADPKPSILKIDIEKTKDHGKGLKDTEKTAIAKTIQDVSANPETADSKGLAFESKPSAVQQQSARKPVRKVALEVTPKVDPISNEVIQEAKQIVTEAFTTPKDKSPKQEQSGNKAEGRGNQNKPGISR